VKSDEILVTITGDEMMVMKGERKRCFSRHHHSPPSFITLIRHS